MSSLRLRSAMKSPRNEFPRVELLKLKPRTPVLDKSAGGLVMIKSRIRKLIIPFVIIALVAIFEFWNTDVKSQSGVAYYEGHVYVTYQFNTLKHPTGLLGLDNTISAGGSNTTSEFHLYISDSGNHVIRDFNGSTGNLSILAGTFGTTGYSNGSLASAQFNYPTGLSGTNTTTGVVNGCDQWYSPPYGHCCTACIQPHIDRYNTQEIYVNDSQNFVVRRICAGNSQSATGNCVGQLGQVVTACGSHAKGYVNSDGGSACFATLAGLMQSGSSYYYIADAENHAIRSWNGVNVYTYAGGSPGFEDGYRTTAKFLAPAKTTMDTSGNMYVADLGNNAVRKIDQSGYVSTCAGGGPMAAGLVDGQGSGAYFSRPTSVVFNAADNMVYVADSHNNCIRRIDSAGNVTTYAGTGAAGLTNGPLMSAQFNMPTEIVIRGSFMYISDTLNNVIRRIDMANGQVSTYIS